MVENTGGGVKLLIPAAKWTDCANCKNKKQNNKTDGGGGCALSDVCQKVGIF